MLVSKDTPPHPGGFTAAKRSNTFLQIEGAGNSLTGLLLPPPAKGTASADWRPYQSHRSGPLGLQHPSRFLRKYLTPTFIALQSWLCFADLRIFSRSLFRGRGVWRSQLTEMHPSSEYDVPKCWYSIFKVLRRAFYLPLYISLVTFWEFTNNFFAFSENFVALHKFRVCFYAFCYARLSPPAL